MAVVLWPTVGGYHCGTVLWRTAALLAIGSTTPATIGQVKGAAGSRDHGDVNVREEGEEKVTSGLAAHTTAAANWRRRSGKCAVVAVEQTSA
jgi:hypothetical protein